MGMPLWVSFQSSGYRFNDAFTRKKNYKTNEQRFCDTSIIILR